MDRRPIDYKASDINDYEKAEVYLNYTSVYQDAIEILLKEFTRQSPSHDYSLAPVLTLLRHFIEMQLKGIIMHGEEEPKTIKTHDISDLYQKAQEKIRIKAKEANFPLPKPIPHVEKFIKKFGNFDPKFQAFRYPETTEGVLIDYDYDPWLYDIVTSISKLNSMAKDVIGDLDGLEGFLDQIRNEKELALENQEVP